ncbi:hypothetical protein A2U01_0102842, partial [Trifolium medium]|nr:hypothetical protein [Trifolium medium]
VNSPSNESVRTVSVEKDHSVLADQGKNDDTDVVNVDDLVSEDRSAERTPAPTIVERL